MEEITVTYKFEEQSKAITGKAGIEAITEDFSDEELERIAKKSEELANRAFEYSLAMTHKYKGGR